MKAILLMISMVAAPVWAAPAQPAAKAPGGKGTAYLVRVTGMARVSRVAAPEAWATAVGGEELYVGDRVATARGRAEIRFADGSQVRLHGKTTLVIKALDAGRGGGRARKTLLHLVSGVIRSIVQPLDQDASFAVTSQTAVAAVKGTKFAFDGTSVAVFDENDAKSHAVALSDPTGGHTTVVGENMIAGMAGGIPEPPRQMEAKEASNLDKALATDGSKDKDAAPAPTLKELLTLEPAEGAADRTPKTPPSGTPPATAAGVPASGQPPGVRSAEREGPTPGGGQTKEEEKPPEQEVGGSAVETPSAGGDVTPGAGGDAASGGTSGAEDRSAVTGDVAPAVQQPIELPDCGTAGSAARHRR